MKSTAAILRYTKVWVMFSRAVAREPPAKVCTAAPGTMHTMVKST